MSSVSQLIESDGISVAIVDETRQVFQGVQEIVVKDVDINLKVLMVMKAIIVTNSNSDRLA